MADITKPAGSSCPKCGTKPAEFTLASEKFTRWRCACGAEGRIAVRAPAAPAPKVLPHWTTRKAA